MRPVVDKIVSGGQTGADRGGLDAAIKLGIPHGGWCPKGRRAEDGKVPARYKLRETAASNYQSRTSRNVLDSDGTVIFTRGPLEGGSLLTERIAREVGKPCMTIDLKQIDNPTATMQRLCVWLVENGIRVLNVAGSRESKARGLQDAVTTFLIDALAPAARRYQVDEERIVVDNMPELAAAEDAESYGERSRPQKPPR